MKVYRLHSPMPPSCCHFVRLMVLGLLMSGIALTANAQDGPPQFVRDAVRAVETMLKSEGDPALEMFIDNAMVPSKDRNRADLIDRLRSLRKEVIGLRDDIAVEAEPDGVRLILSAGGVEKQIKVMLGPAGISDLTLLKAAEPITLTCDNLKETFDRLAAEGMSGVVYVQLDGEVALEHAFGMANTELGIPNVLTTVFGIGSRPIDYTIAAISLLDQQGHISLDDTIGKYFERVPANKRSITIRHLMTGASGLPDFFDTDDDWDPDLAWVDRTTAEQRMLSQELLFVPGAERKHSHGAFGLLAALVERVSGMPYYGFIRKNFLDPAGMARTGEYGESRGLSVRDFAVGGGPQFVGLPNIPPNWGPTSWLVKGSGGMYSTLGDLLAFYDFVRSGSVLDSLHSAAFRQPSASVDGSDRGFELFSAYNPPGNESFLFLNVQGDRGRMQQLFRALGHLTNAKSTR